MPKDMKKIFLIIIFLYCLTGNFDQLESKSKNNLISLDSPLNIEANTLDILYSEKKAIFTGKVKAVQEEITLTTDKLEIAYNLDNENGELNFDKLNCFGNVLISFNDQFATSELAEYDVKKNIIILENNVIIGRDQSSAIKTGKVVIDMNTGKIDTKSQERVNAIININ